MGLKYTLKVGVGKKPKLFPARQNFTTLCLAKRPEASTTNSKTMMAGRRLS
jgi:hypothetical protein